LNEDEYDVYSMQYIKKLISLLKEDEQTSNIPIILFARDPSFNTNKMTESNADCLSLFWNINKIDLNVSSRKSCTSRQPKSKNSS
jgi:uroporphyrinogen-III decarboxylase